MSKPIKQSDMTFEAINRIIWQHLVERGWDKPKSRGLAISIALEANELLEHYQWDDTAVGDSEALGDELADILIYAFEFAQQNDIDIAEAIQRKLHKSALKYPAESFKGKQGTEMREAWLAAKMSHKKEGL
jgi:NTP pyrophosphatase (non-canonical NTP hydrolase)